MFKFFTLMTLGASLAISCSAASAQLAKSVQPAAFIEQVTASPAQIDPCAKAASSTDSLDFLSGNKDAKHIIILIGGIHNTYHYFDSWVSKLSSTDTAVIGWNHDHSSMRMTLAASELSCQIAELKNKNVESLTIIAHSMGALVAKGAIDSMSAAGKTDAYAKIDLWTLGAPWGGFALADMMLIMPWSAQISQAIGLPMGIDIGPSSGYMKNLSQPMPMNGSLHIFLGTDDTIALPEVDSTKKRYDSIQSLATSVSSVEGSKHDDYNILAVTDVIAALHHEPAKHTASLPATLTGDSHE